MDEKENAQSILDVFKKSEDTHEKNLIYITAGALAISLSFIDKIVPPNSPKSPCLLISAWIALLLSLVVNLLSHRYAADFLLDKYHEFLNSENDKTGRVGKALKKHNDRMRIGNWTSVILLLIGIGLLVTFCSINIL